MRELEVASLQRLFLSHLLPDQKEKKDKFWGLGRWLSGYALSSQARGQEFSSPEHISMPGRLRELSAIPASKGRNRMYPE